MYIICRVSHLCVRGDISHSTISVVHPQLYSSENRFMLCMIYVKCAFLCIIKNYDYNYLAMVTSLEYNSCLSQP